MRGRLLRAVLACAIAAATIAASNRADAVFAGATRLAANPAAPVTKVVSITDPVLNMPAYSITIPTNWFFEGAVFPGTSCSEAPFPVFRITSPDGLTGIKQLPRLDWAWSDNPRQPSKSGADCLPYKKEIPASEVLKYMVGVLQVEFVKDEPTPDLAEIQREHGRA